MHKNIILFGANGMMGTYIKRIINKTKFNLIPLTRKDIDITKSQNEIETRLLSIMFSKNLTLDNTTIINCAGLINSRTETTTEFIKANSLFPHYLQEISENYDNCKLIHLSTDCVYDGSKDIIRNDRYYSGNYEDNTTSCNDIYSQTKILGEPSNASVIRTSIIGNEIKNTRSLISKLRVNSNKVQSSNFVMDGFKNAYWNGVTCLTLAGIIMLIIEKDLYWKGIRNIFTPDTVVSKSELLSMVIKKYDLNIKIIPVDLPLIPCNRALSTRYPEFLRLFDIDTLEHQIHDQKYYDDYYDRFCDKIYDKI